MQTQSKSSGVLKIDKNSDAWLKNLQHYGDDYCNNSSIHGLKYLGERRSSCEKLWWFMVFLLSVFCCIFLITKIYEKYETSPILISVASETTPIYTLPFPAITICPDAKLKGKEFNFTNVFFKLEDNETVSLAEKQKFGFASLICNNQENLDNETSIESSNSEFYKFLQNMTPEFTPLHCGWLYGFLSCRDLFTPIVLDEGLCYTFNMLDREDLLNPVTARYEDFHNINISVKDWNPDTLRYGSNNVDAYPMRALLQGAKASLRIILLTADENLDYRCRDSIQGYKVTIHHPASIPRPAYDYIRVPLGKSVSVGIQPVLIKTKRSLMDYQPKVRGCYFPTERALKFFKIYTQSNCYLECLTNFTLRICNCTGYYMPHTNETAVCGPRDLTCLTESEEIFFGAGVVIKFKDGMEADFIKEIMSIAKIDCVCLPSCTSIEYNKEISQGEWNIKKVVKSYRYNITEVNPCLTATNTHSSRLEVFLKANEIIGLERHELYGPTDFLANFGGLLGLFTGFSLLSFMEIVYFLSLRLVCNFRLFGNNWLNNGDGE